MVGVTTEDEFRMVYHIFMLHGLRPNMDDLATKMGLKRDATNWRYNKLMKRLQAEFGGPGTSATAVTNAGGNPTTTTTSTKTGGSAKKKATGGRKRKEPEEESDDSSEENDKIKKKIKKSIAAEGEDVGASEEIGGVDVEG